MKLLLDKEASNFGSVKMKDTRRVGTGPEMQVRNVSAQGAVAAYSCLQLDPSNITAQVTLLRPSTISAARITTDFS